MSGDPYELYRAHINSLRANCCGQCKQSLQDDIFYTEVNPPGGYGQSQLLICDACMETEDWKTWKQRKKEEQIR